MKIAIAMSGGVDSSVAAALAVKEYGNENVFGVTMKLFCYGENLEARGLRHEADKSCCSLDAIADAAAVCKQLDIAHYVINLEKEFESEVINNFVSEYEKGMTPNPCIRCNQFIKYEYLLNKVFELGADVLVTGHYARISSYPMSSMVTPVRAVGTGGSKDDGVSYFLLKGLDQKKDQSYFLYNLTQAQLAHVQFPIGELEKTETRRLAKELGLKTAEKTESQDICFVTTTTQDFLSKRIKQKPGDIVVFSPRHSRDLSVRSSKAKAEGGNLGFSSVEIVGQHNGLSAYTIGQRKGLGGGFSEIMYVIGLDSDKNQVVVGTREQLYSDKLMARDMHWVSGTVPAMPFKCMAKIRYNSSESECVISSIIPNEVRDSGKINKELDSSDLPQNDGILVTFTLPQLAITPGQSVVFYDGDEVIGGGIISSAVSS